MKLFVDDIRNAPDDKWYVARTLSEAIRCIEYYAPEITEISLDHDISHQIQMGEMSRPFPCPDTYAALCYFIGRVYEEKDNVPKIVLHTSNKVGAENMELILAKYKIPCTIEMRGAANRLEMDLRRK